MQNQSDIKIVSYDPRHQPAFESLNAEWLTRWFVIEDVDRRVLADPQRYIIADGGEVLFAVDGDDRVVGTVALLHEGGSVNELTKMAVAADQRGNGVGRALMLAAIRWYRQQNGVQLFLESSLQLTPALTLYESVGFRHHPAPRPGSHYDRADVYMIYEPENQA